jgi:chromosome segregation ATPase
MLAKQLVYSEKDVEKLQDEKKSLEDKLQDYDETKRLVQSLQSRLDEYRSELGNLNSEKDRLQKSKVMFSHSLPQLEQSKLNRTLFAFRSALMRMTVA